METVVMMATTTMIVTNLHHVMSARQRSREYNNKGLLLLQMLLHVHRDHRDYYSRGAQDGHLFFHTATDFLKKKKKKGPDSPSVTHLACE